MSLPKQERIDRRNGEQLERLEHDLKQVLDHAVTVWGNHLMWKHIRDAAITQPWITEPPQLFNWIARSHSSMIALYIRRAQDPDDRAISLQRCLCRIACGHVKITRERFVARYVEKNPNPSEEARAFAVHEFEKIAGTGATYLPSAMAASDLDSLREQSRRVVAWVDKRIAHFDQRPPDHFPSPDEIEGILRLVTELGKKWYAHLTSVQYAVDTPILGNLWHKPLRTPWLVGVLHEGLSMPVVPGAGGHPAHQQRLGPVPWITTPHTLKP